MHMRLIAAAVLAGLALAVPSAADGFKPGKWALSTQRITGTVVMSAEADRPIVPVDTMVPYTGAEATLTLLPEGVFVARGYARGELTGNPETKTIGSWRRDGDRIELDESSSVYAFTAVICGDSLVICRRDLRVTRTMRMNLGISLTFTRTAMEPALVDAQNGRAGKPGG